MRFLRLFLVAAGLLAVNTGCSYKMRNVTAETWDPEGKGAYVAYWEGTCSFGCGVGDGKLLYCRIDPATNDLACTPQEGVNALLDKSAR